MLVDNFYEKTANKLFLISLFITSDVYAINEPQLNKSPTSERFIKGLNTLNEINGTGSG